MFAIIPHGWFLHAGSTRLYRTAAQTTLAKQFLPRIAQEEKPQVIILSAPEPEAIALARDVAMLGGYDVQINDCLSDAHRSPSPNEIIAHLCASDHPFILVTHRPRLKAIVRAVNIAVGTKIKITGRRPLFWNQAMIVDPGKKSIEVVSIK